MNIPKLTPGERSIFSAIYSNPRSSLQELGEIVGKDRSTVAYHVRRLERLKLVSSELMYLPNDDSSMPLCMRICHPAAWTLA